MSKLHTGLLMLALVVAAGCDAGTYVVAPETPGGVEPGAGRVEAMPLAGEFFTLTAIDGGALPHESTEQGCEIQGVHGPDNVGVTRVEDGFLLFLSDTEWMLRLNVLARCESPDGTKVTPWAELYEESVARGWYDQATDVAFTLYAGDAASPWASGSIEERRAPGEGMPVQQVIELKRAGQVLEFQR